MVDPLVGEQPYFVKGFWYELFLAPINIPVVVLGLLEVPFEECGWYAVGEIGFKFDVGAK